MYNNKYEILWYKMAEWIVRPVTNKEDGWLGSAAFMYLWTSRHVKDASLVSYTCEHQQ